MCALPLYIRLWFWLFLWLLGSTTVSERVAAAQGSLPQPLPLAPGAEALGRGGAFVAKADSPLALEYNVAGLAQLRGTQVLLDASLFLPEARLRTCRPWSQEALRPRYGGLLAITTERSRGRSRVCNGARGVPVRAAAAVLRTVGRSLPLPFPVRHAGLGIDTRRRAVRIG